MSNELPFILLTAFSSNPFGGNPAAVVFLQEELPDDTLHNIAKNFDQPIVSYLYPSIPSDSEKAAAFGIRWFTTTGEVPLCGHGTLAATKAIMSTPGLISDNVEVIQFHAKSGVVMTARKGDGHWLEVELPSYHVEEVQGKDRERLGHMVARAIGADNGSVVKYIAKGVKGYEYGLLVELDESVNLGQCKVNANELLGSGYIVHVLTTASTDHETLFVSRMFAPSHLNGGEDHVCGSAHCLLAPYWSRKKNVEKNAEIRAKQVSARGGDIRVIWDQDQKIIRLMGELAIFAKGTFIL